MSDSGSKKDWGKQPHRLIDLEEAWEQIARIVRPLPTCEVDVRQAFGRVLAEPIVANDDFPPFDKSMMDGFAVRSVDCAVCNARLTIAGLAAAGGSVTQQITAGSAVRINTGAPLPPGTDAVVRIEDAQISSDGSSVTIGVAATTGMNVSRRGAHVRQRDIVLAPPLKIEAPQIAVMAANGLTSVRVYPEVTVGVVTTGNELVPPGTPRGPGQIFESNGPMLGALMRQFGAQLHDCGVARDDPQELRERLSMALRHPIAVASGGMSMGTLDLVPEVFTDLGVEWKFHGVQVRPGKPIAYGVGPDGQHVFGLPGNPVSAYVCSWLFVRMAVRGLMGHAVLPPHRWRASLNREMKATRDARPAFVPARVWNDDQRGMVADPCGWGGSGDPFGQALANALIVRENPTEAAAVGCHVNVIFISTDP
ncbi:MAG: molybdopterin molybdotransferase MoeA [Phycisphaerae bacterium]|nr:molybdopterin molybdotransferase MoeA [Phycisphaerae bacterium]